MSDRHDVIVIGGGSAGYAAARTAKENGAASVAIVDGAQELGGLCILRGCMPSKTLLHAAEILHQAKNGHRLGLRIPAAEADMAAVQKRKKALIHDDFQAYRVEQLRSDKYTLYQSSAAFVDPQTIQLGDGRLLMADKFIIATGSRVNRPAIPGLDCDVCPDSDEILNLESIPESVIVLGGGVVACELGQFLLRMGAKVTLIQRSETILHNISEQAGRAVAEALRKEGMEIFTGTRLQLIERARAGVCVSFEHNNGTVIREAAMLFNALGRKPCVEGLGLEKANVALNEKGFVETDDFQQTSNPNIYAAGDVCGKMEIVHIAIMQGETAARHAMGASAEPVDYESVTSVVFTDPAAAYAGKSAGSLRADGFELIEAEFPFADLGKAILMEAPHGYVKCWADRRTGRLLGAECVGKDAAELIHPMAVAVKLGGDVRELVKVHWYHPTLSEIWSYPLEDIAEEL